MAEHIRYCSPCKKYTLQETCPRCTAPTNLPRPPKFSLDEKYADLKREAKKEEYKEHHLY